MGHYRLGEDVGKLVVGWYMDHLHFFIPYTIFEVAHLGADVLCTMGGFL